MVRAHSRGLVFAGPDAALAPIDQLRYLSWIRQAGLHMLIADPYRVGAAHVYLHPLFLLSGLLWRAGISVQAAYYVWTPVALFAALRGYAAYTGRFVSGRPRAAALLCSLMFFSPLVPFLDWGRIVGGLQANDLVIVAGHAAAYWQAWGYLPTVLALGLMPLFLLGVERQLSGIASRRSVVATGLAGLLAAWLHPWGGIELVFIAVGMLALSRFRKGWTRVSASVAATTLPLAYYALISGSGWSLSAVRTSFAIAPQWWPLLVVGLPLLTLAALALRRSEDVGEQMLLLWPVAVLVVYVTLGRSARLTALEGISLPLSILAVKGWRRLSASRALGTAALIVGIVPGMAYSAATMHDLLQSHGVPYALSRDEARALHALGSERRRILATPYLAASLPAISGVASVNDPFSPTISATRLNAAFDGQMTGPELRRLIDDASVDVLVSDCLPGRVDLTASLSPDRFELRRYGCASVYWRQRFRRP